MRNLQVLFNECLKELDALGIQYGNITAVEINTRAQKRYGQCKKISDNSFKITISDRALKDTVELVYIKEIIHHEILHSCHGCLNHGNEWKRLASCVNRAYGYDIQRLVSSENFNEKPYEKAPPKYLLICNDCNKEYTRNKATKVIRNYKKYRCGCCGGSLSLKTL